MPAARFTGRPASPGLAHGPLVVLAAAEAKVRVPGDAYREAAALGAAIRSAIDALNALAARANGAGSDILGFQVAMLEDDTLSEGAYAEIAAGTPADLAWRGALDREIGGYLAGDDEYFRARAADLEDIRDRVLQELTGGAASAIPPGSVVFAQDLTPSRFLSTDWTGGAVVLAAGSPTSHVAVLARGRGVPMIVCVDADAAALRPLPAEAVVDAARGILLIGPDAADFDAYAAWRAAASDAAAELHTFRLKPARTADGTRIAVHVNIADPAELDRLDPAACDGIGLVRTELLFGGGPLPDEEHQTAIYRRIVRWAAGKPVTIRTLDAGGDKPIPGVTEDGEANPFLGLRGVRLTLKHRDMFRTQLRALCRAAADGPIEVMIPMVTVPDELSAARALLAEALTALDAEGIDHARPAFGMMVEVPAAAIAIDLFDADFYSIGSNDLTQYVTAAGRDIASVAHLADPAHPAVLRLIERVVAHGAGTGRKVSLCGDAGGDPRMLPLLLAAGLRIVSVSPTLIGATKAAIAAIDLGGEGAVTARSQAKIASSDAVGIYKRILADVLDRRPSGTRQRLASALGKNRSFVTQITNAAYPAPVPAQHLAAIFDTCHFSPAERQSFLDAYHAAHPRRLVSVAHGPATRRIALDLPDLGDERRNRDLEDLLEDIARRLVLIVRGSLRGET